MALHDAQAENVQNARGHLCVLVLTETQAEDVERNRILRRKWFGEGWSVPVKNSLGAAVSAFSGAGNNSPTKVIEFYVTYEMFHDWVHSDNMRACPWVDGYRMCFDIHLNNVDPHYKLHTFD